jgi:hypothetical protein
MKFIIAEQKAWISRVDGVSNTGKGLHFAEWLPKTRRFEHADWLFEIKEDGIFATSEREYFCIVGGKYHDITDEMPDDFSDFMRENWCSYGEAWGLIWERLTDRFISLGGNP